MLTFLFWNIDNADLDSVVGRLAERHRVDVVMLAECAIPAAKLLERLNPGKEAAFFLASDSMDKVSVYTRFRDDSLKRLIQTRRYTIWHVECPGSTKILLTTAHLPDKINRRDFSERAVCTQLVTDIQRAESNVRHERTLVVGDLNMNPFEDEVVGVDKLNAVMTQELAKRKPRRIYEQRYPFFYNPMWRFFGDSGRHPSGTHYCRNSPYFWNLFDQVLVRPELLSVFQNETLTILDSDGTVSFLNRRGLPESSRISDHLPILFQLDL